MRLALCLCLSAASAVHAQLGPCTIETIAGGGTIARGDGGPAVDAELLLPRDVRVGPDGALYIADSGHHRIRRVLPDGVIETFAGTGVDEISGDGGLALEAGLASPRSLAFAPDGSLYFLDFGPAPQLRRITPDGLIATVAGGADSEGVIDEARLIAAGPDGTVYTSDARNHRILRIGPEGEVTIVAGTGQLTPGPPIDGDGGPALEARLNAPREIAAAPDGMIYFVDNRDRVVRRILPDGTIETYLANGPQPPDDGALRGEFQLVLRGGNLEIDGQGRVYWRDNVGIRRIGLDDRLETVWTRQRQRTSIFVAVADDGTVFRILPDQIFRVESPAEDFVVAGLGVQAPRGDGGPAVDATFRDVTSVAVGANAEIYVADWTRVRVIAGDRIDPFAGTGEPGEPLDGALALESGFPSIVDLAVGPSGALYIAARQAIYRVDRAGAVVKVAGTGVFGGCRGSSDPCGDGGPAVDADLRIVHQIATDGGGNLYIAHEDRSTALRVRVVPPDGTIRTMRFPDGRQVRVADIGSDVDGNLLLARGIAGVTLWRVTPRGEFTQLEGLDGLIARTRELTAGPNGSLFFTDLEANVRRLTVSRVLQSIVPRLSVRESRLEGMAVGEADFSAVADLAADPASGDLLIAGRTADVVVRINRAEDCAVIERPQLRGGVVNGASFTFRVSPGTIVSGFGVGLGPTPGVGGRIEGERLTSEAGGVRVLVDGVPATMLFASAGQINAIIPHGAVVSGRFTTIRGMRFFRPDRVTEVVLEVNGVLSETQPLGLFPASPALFALSAERAAALNEDGSVNGPLAPAAPGSVIVLFGTGAGVTDPPSVDGAVTGSELPRPREPVEVMFGDRAAEVLYAGAAPGLVSGVIQVNARIAADQEPIGPTPVRWKVGEFENEDQRIHVLIGR